MIVTLNPLDGEALVKILTEQGAIKQYQKLFEMDDTLLELSLTPMKR